MMKKIYFVVQIYKTEKANWQPWNLMPIEQVW
jgi:hypothetical protein